MCSVFSWGDGDYEITVNENIQGNQYSQAFKGNCQVTLKDQLTPFLYPNQYVKFTKDSQAVAESEILVQAPTTTWRPSPRFMIM